MAWYLNRALTTFRNEVNAEYPERDKASDGTIGDEAHQASTSDHNPDGDGSVDAWDMDVDLRSGNDAAEIERLKQVFQRHPAARYWIHNRQIAHRSTGWKRERYTGANPHDKHVHWNSEPSQETSTRPWGVKKEVPDLDSKQDAKLTTAFEILTRWHAGMLVMADGKTANPPVQWRVRDEAWQKAKDERDAKLALEVTALKGDLASIKTALATPPGTVVVSDEQLERVLRKVIGSVDGV